MLGVAVDGLAHQETNRIAAIDPHERDARVLLCCRLEAMPIAGIEVGARNPSLKALERLADALSVTLSELFGQ